MNSPSLARSLSVSVRVYRALLAAYPKKFREDYGTEMVQVFRDSVREAFRQRRRRGLLDVWLHTFADLLVTALMERVMERSRTMYSPKYVVWGAVAAAFGGLMWMLPLLAPTSGELALTAGMLLTLGGLAALRLRQGKQAGMLGGVGLVLAILGTGLVVVPFVRDLISPNSLDLEHDAGAALILLAGMVVLGLGSMLIGLRALQTGIPGRASGILSVVVGVLQAAFGFSVWLIYYEAAVLGINPWNPMSVPAWGALLLSFAVGALWMALGAVLAQDPGWQVSNQPPASA